MKTEKIMEQIDNLFERKPKESQCVWNMLYFGCIDIFFDNELHNNMSNEEIDNFFDKDIKQALSVPSAEYWSEYKPFVRNAFEKILRSA